MRPVRLELHGFTAFRDEVTVDFAGADLFALAGPTGAGKSSIIDGMCFALYGSVPRLDRRTVAPVISTGRNEARIRFDFTVNETPYTAARVVRRTAGGATTKEARLEGPDGVIAGDADGMTDAVERLLGLGFDQFAKSVVLPQGDFARFLHDKPSGRQDLLVRLLEMDVYARMRAAANTRKVAADSAVELLADRLVALAGATPEVLADAAGRLERLARLRDEIDKSQPRIDELVKRREDRLAVAEKARTAAGLAAGVTVPDGIDALAADVAAAEQRLAEATKSAAAADTALTGAETAREALGDAGALERIRTAREERATLASRLARGEPIVAAARTDEQSAQAAVGAAEDELTAATETAEAVRREHAAHALAATLREGDDCPVCRQAVATLPQRDAPTALAAADRCRTEAAATLEKARATVAKAAETRSRAEQTLTDVTEALAAVDARLDGAPSDDEIERRLGEITKADADLVTARERDRAARGAARTATEAAQQAAGRRDSAWSAFDAARDAVAALGPPPADRRDLHAAWTSLAGWAGTSAAEQSAAARDAESDAGTATAELAEVETGIAARCEECEVSVTRSTRARDAVADAVARAAADRTRIKADLASAAELRDQVAAATENAAVAKALGRHLSARGFEQWLLDEALTRLAEGASTVLRDLSSGQYSLALDAQRNFVVVDHRSADDQRPARTLSGGETFLASLSLALTLADHLATLAVGAEPRLESIFLDEGFGTLDPETLDTVAAAIEELGARGRTVGIVTHVRDLADRMPVRYDVAKGPGGSTVERVER